MSQFAAQPTPGLMPDELLYGIDGAVATVTLNAPQRMNTISGPMLKQLTEALVRANEDPTVRVVILTGTGAAPSAPGSISRRNPRAPTISVSARGRSPPISTCATRRRRCCMPWTSR